MAGMASGGGMTKRDPADIGVTRAFDPCLSPRRVGKIPDAERIIFG
jgi:hypothetical protein